MFNLARLFSPQAIAVIGASHQAGKLGYDVLMNVTQFGYTGKVYPVNPKVTKIAGITTYPTVTAVAGLIDVAVICIPAVFVANALEECGKKQIPFVVIISAGFKEVSSAGAVEEEKLLAIAKRYNIQLVGPNCLGYLNVTKKLNASFTAGMPKLGNISLVSQSGAMNVAMLDWAYQTELGFSKIISLGNKSGIDEVDCLEYLGTDADTAVIMLYLESLERGVEFMKVASRISVKKPIIVLKAGSSPQAQSAIRSHTGSLAGSEEAINAAFAKTGVIRAATIEQFFDLGLAFSSQPPPHTRKIAIITNAGGPGIMATDAAQKTIIDLSPLRSSIQTKLKTGLPAAANTKNPIDVIGDAPAERYAHALNTVLADKTIGGAVVILTPQTMTNVQATAECIITASKKYSKPILTSFMGWHNVQVGRDLLRHHQIPQYNTPERAIYVMNQLIAQAERKTKLFRGAVETPFDKLRTSLPRLPDTEGHPQIETIQAEKILRKYHLPVVQSRLIKTIGDCATLNRFPVVMKIASRDIIHKAASGGIVLNITSVAAAKRAFKKIKTACHAYNPRAEFSGVLVQNQLTISHKDKEVIIGMKRDPAFGPVLMFGLGGSMVEMLKDVSFGIAPLSLTEAYTMIHAIRTAPLLAKNDLEVIAKTLVAVAQIVFDYPNISELDINPMLVRQAGYGGYIVDVRMMI